MTAETSVTSKWPDLKSNNELRELAESHHAILLRNISKRTGKEKGSPKQNKTGAKTTLLTLPSSPTVSEQVLEPEAGPSAKKVVVRRHRRSVLTHRGGSSTYKFNRDKLPVLLARAKELVKTWHEPKVSSNSIEETRRKMREKCSIFTINHSKADKDCVQPTNPLYISMEFRKSLIRHDWAGVKKLLKVLLRSPFKEDRITWKMVITTLYYYPGAEAALRECIERNRNMFGGLEILRGLLEINGMEPYTYKKSSKLEQEDLLSAPLTGNDHGKKKKKKKSKKKDGDEEVIISDGKEGSN